ncbi:MAG: ComEC/Rec2 family competence protein [Synechococcus sp. SB0678_bin_12]|nr:ComEC/Rec2 family competence protein [Synechococcus sp. SB0678_bin_12]MYI88136.1 ComEC/Rec2 family competence protein [Synechococcus sp. SB0672_bin_10]
MLWLGCAAVLTGLVLGGLEQFLWSLPAAVALLLLTPRLAGGQSWAVRWCLPCLLVVAFAGYGQWRAELAMAGSAFTPADEQQAVAVVAQVRSHLVQAYTEAFSSPSGPLLAALVMGQKMAQVPDIIREDFRRAGLSHALAASGFHLSVLLSSVLLMAGQRRLLRLGLGALVILGFIVLAGSQPSVVRAALMAGLGLLLLSLKTRQRPVGVLLVAVIAMLLIAPVWVQSLGFQFSVVATMGLVVSAGPMGEGLSRWLPQRLAMAMAVPLAATCWTIPLQLLHFGRLPLYGIPVNLLLTPILAPLTLTAMVMAPVLLLPPVLTGWLLAVVQPVVVLVVRCFLWMVHGAASLPMAEMPLGQPVPVAAVLLVAACLWWLVPRPTGAAGRPWRRPWLAPVLLLLALALQLQMRFADEIRQLGWSQRRGATTERHRMPAPFLVARHGGRAALISSTARLPFCRRARKELHRLGLDGFDWILVTYRMSEEQRRCWAPLSQQLVRGHDGRLVPGMRLESPGLALVPLSYEAHAYGVTAGSRRARVLIGPAAQRWASSDGGAVLDAWPPLSPVP